MSPRAPGGGGGGERNSGSGVFRLARGQACLDSRGEPAGRGEDWEEPEPRPVISARSPGPAARQSWASCDEGLRHRWGRFWRAPAFALPIGWRTPRWAGPARPARCAAAESQGRRGRGLDELRTSGQLIGSANAAPGARALNPASPIPEMPV